MSRVILETNRLYVRTFEEKDLDNLYKLHSNAEVAKTTSDGIQSLKKVKCHLKDFIIHQNKYDFSQWAIHIKETNHFIGRAGFTKRKLSDDTEQEVEIRFAILPNFWNKGYVSEIAEYLIQYAKQDLRLNKIVSSNHANNEISIKILSRLGFKFIKKIKPEDLGIKFKVDYRELLLN